jgi:surfeit locus 1 family protein
MRLHFRPLPVYSVVTAIMLAILLSLGFWQVQRLHWKLGLIAQVNRNLALPPVSLQAALKMGPDAEYRHVSLNGRFLHAKESYAYAVAPGGTPVYHVITPFLTDNGLTFLVDRGLVPLELRDPVKRPAGQVEGEQHVVGVWRTPDAPGFFTPQADRARRIWFSRNAKAIAAADHVSVTAPVMIEADATPVPGGWPKGGQTVVTFRNEHLQYAITWFGLAAALLGIYVAMHISKGRLSWRRVHGTSASLN